MSLVTLMTDFGLKDGNVGVMKGVIHNIAPEATMVDISHQIAPQNILETNYVLTRSVPYFPAGTVHIFVIDPGVGTARKPMIAQLGDQYFVGPDNGALTGLILKARADGVPCRFFELDKPEYWLPKVSHVFHGRDIFAPSAAHFAAGTPIEKLGTEFYEPVLIDQKPPTIEASKITGQIVYVDHFGSLASNITEEQVAALSSDQSLIKVTINDHVIEGMVNTFGERPHGSLICLYSSTGVVIVSVVNGSASNSINGKIGDIITLNI